MSERKKYLIGISIGDFNGIGIEVILKTFSDNRMMEFCTPVLYGSSKLINYHRKILNLNSFIFAQSNSIEKIQANTFNIINCWDDDPQPHLGQSTEAAGKFALLSLKMAAKDLMEGKINALVTAPINKKNIQSPDFSFAGHTGFLAQLAGVTDYCMLLCSNDFRVGLLTEHIPVADIANHITRDKILKKLQILKKTLFQDFGIEKPKIAVLGLNPHSGDDGLIGKEEVDIIKPAIDEARNNLNVLTFGPYPADGFFGNNLQKKFDAVLGMYHDQVLVPFKTLCFNSGVNYTAGLPFVRTSPDHGVAYDIAGKNLASEDSFRESVFLAVDILNKRNGYREMTANPIRKSTFKTERY